MVNGLISRLENGYLSAAAGMASWRDKAQRIQKRNGPISIDSEWWENADDFRNHWDNLWVLGDFTANVYDDEMARWIDVRFSDVRFEATRLYLEDVIPRPEQVQREQREIHYGLRLPEADEPPIAAPVSPPSPPRPSRNDRGAGKKPFAFWEDAILAVAARWYEGDWKPKNQAEVQTALENWLDDNGHEAGPTAIKERARKIWISFKD